LDSTDAALTSNVTTITTSDVRYPTSIYLTLLFHQKHLMW
jgi:hypothetical protein